MMRCPPEFMSYRRSVRGDFGDSCNGCIAIPARKLFIIFSNGGGWEHVSVSLADRCPTWDEMDSIKRLFWEPHDTVMQLHVPPSDHVNYHQYCLHLWRPLYTDIPRPPAFMVA